MRALVLLLFGLSALSPRAQALSCSSRPICAPPKDDEAVFVGVVVRQGHKARSDEEPARPTLFRVVESFHGLPEGESEVEVWSSMLKQFEPGTRWILDAERDREEGFLRTKPCGHTGRLDDGVTKEVGEMILDFLRSRRSGTAPTTVLLSAYTSFLSDAELFEPVTVQLSGPHEYAFTIDPHGSLRRRQPIEPGEYQVSAQSPEAPFAGRESFVAQAGTCESLRLPFGPRTLVSGRVFTPEGEPASGTTVTLEADYGPDDELRQADRLGKFEFRGMRAGKYVVKAFDPKLRETYYPGVESRVSATPVTVKEDAPVEDVDFQFTRKLDVAQVSLVVVGLDGKPLASTPVHVSVREHFEGKTKNSFSTGGETDYRGGYPLTSKVGARLVVSLNAGPAAELYSRSKEPLETGRVEVVVLKPEQTVEIRMTERLCPAGLLRWEPCDKAER